MHLHNYEVNNLFYLTFIELCAKAGISPSTAAGIPILAGITIVTAVPAALKHGDLAEQFGNPEQLVLCTFQHPQQPV